jgi:hypothetical protein
MDFFIDSAILVTAVVGTFGTAFMIQSAALRLILKAMNRRRDLGRTWLARSHPHGLH